MIFFCISASASVIGALCGIGGGIVIKPLLDVLNLVDVAQASLLSTSTVLAMSAYSVIRNFAARDGTIDLASATPLALGAALGGLAGKQLFVYFLNNAENESTLGLIQSACLLVLTAGTLAATVFDRRLPRADLKSAVTIICIGLLLGATSSFLGIGGGPINLVVLSLLFSMDTKTAAQNSLYIILVSQVANIGSLILGGEAPSIDPTALAVMISGGIAGGCAGRAIHKYIDNRRTRQLFICLQACILVMCAFTIRRYLGGG